MKDTKRPSWLQGIQERLNERLETTQRQNDIIGDMFNVIDQNVTALKQANTKTDLEGTPQFLRNHVQENQLSETTIAKIAQEKVAVPSTASVKQAKEQTQVQTGPQADPEKKLLDKKIVRTLEPALKARVFGQDPVIDLIVKAMKTNAARMNVNKNKPAGCYMFAGPSGVGKTELAQCLADSLHAHLLHIDMGEYGLEQDVTKLIGTSAGYVGYENGGLLTTTVKEKRTCVVLLDEFEKAHTSIDKILLSIMDRGICTDNTGEAVKFDQTIVICTTNLGAEVEYQSELTKEEKDELRMGYIKEGLRPEIINRFDKIFQFDSIDKEIYNKISTKFMKVLEDVAQEEHSVDLKFAPKLVEFIIENSYDPAMGGRPARRFLEQVVMPPFTDFLLNTDSDNIGDEHPEITMDINSKGQICVKGKNRKILQLQEDTDVVVNEFNKGKFTNKKSFKM